MKPKHFYETDPYENNLIQNNHPHFWIGMAIVSCEKPYVVSSFNVEYQAEIWACGCEEGLIDSWLRNRIKIVNFSH